MPAAGGATIVYLQDDAWGQASLKTISSFGVSMSIGRIQQTLRFLRRHRSIPLPLFLYSTVEVSQT